MPSATIKIFLTHGDPKRLRTAELSNWTGKAVAGPRIGFDIVLACDESQNSCRGSSLLLRFSCAGWRSSLQAKAPRTRWTGDPIFTYSYSALVPICCSGIAGSRPGRRGPFVSAKGPKTIDAPSCRIGWDGRKIKSGPTRGAQTGSAKYQERPSLGPAGRRQSGKRFTTRFQAEDSNLGIMGSGMSIDYRSMCGF
jgi:hypothetical protein